MANWIWYPGDFELYHSLCQNFDREERGFFWPANWKATQYHHCVKFSYDYELEEETEIRVTAQGRGYVNVRHEAPPPPWLPKERLAAGGVFYAEQKLPLQGVINCPAGRGGVDIILCDVSGFPCALVEGEVLESGKGWMASDQVENPIPAGWNTMYTRSEQNPRVFEYTSEVLEAIKIEEVNGGLLYDFGRELTAETLIEYPADVQELTLCYGESRPEALDVEMCYLKQKVDLTESADPFGGGCKGNGRYRTRLRAFRYIFVPKKETAEKCSIRADYKYVDFPVRADFTCSDERINRIWQVADVTFRLASGIFFLDGIKRDRYIWSGDAYQSYFINQYLFFDEEICKRTMVALRGVDPITQHINGILDYSMYWLLGLEQFYQMTGDKEFLAMMWPKMKAMMGYLEQQIDENGFLYGRPGDWVFVDWADLDKDGPISAEQFLLARSYQAMTVVGRVLKVPEEEYLGYQEKQRNLLENIRKFYWDEEQGAFIDSFTSGRKKVSRHQNIFAVLFDYATEEERTSILQQVLLNDAVSTITTPYFKFYELEALAQMGQLDSVMNAIRSYWGGMLDRGTDTFWEEYKPEEPEDRQYGMYGDPYGKSLCHAWGASPIYLLGRYICGLVPTAPGYETWQIAPNLTVLPEFCATLPLKDGSVRLEYVDGQLTVETDKAGGTLVLEGKEYPLVAGEKLNV